MATSPSFAQSESSDITTWSEISANPSVENLSYFIVNNPASPFAEEAFCALYRLNNSAATDVMAFAATGPTALEAATYCGDIAGLTGVAPSQLMNV